MAKKRWPVVWMACAAKATSAVDADTAVDARLENPKVSRTRTFKFLKTKL